MELKEFATLIRIRDSLKRINQISWSISTIEKKFPIETLDDVGFAVLMQEYAKYAQKAKEVVEEVEAELKKVKIGGENGGANQS